MSRDSVRCCGGVGSVSDGYDGLIGGADGDWGGVGGFQKEAGRLGLGARQFGLSKRFGMWTEGSLWGGGSLQPLEWPGLDRLDLQEVPLSSRSAGGMYRGDPLHSVCVVVRKHVCHIVAT